MPTRSELLDSGLRLHAYLERHHVSRGLVHGPDAGVRLNLRAWRFLKSAVPFFPWRDDYVFQQTQGYWILSNWMLFEATGEARFRDLALDSTVATLVLQTSEGYWRYPLPERRHLIASVEGNWGAIGLLASYARQGNREHLAGAVRWYEFLTKRIGFQKHGEGEAVNYFDRPRGKVPNNSVEAAWLFLRLWEATGNERYLVHVEPLLRFVAAVQLPNGELPYVVESPHEKRRAHYLCFQYNAFQFLKLAWSQALKPGTLAEGVLRPLAHFLEAGVRPDGQSAVDCEHARRSGPEVDYYTAALGTALDEAAGRGLADSQGAADRCYARVLARQKADGGFGYSTGDYGFLHDERSYPRPLAMTLFHLLYGAGHGDGFPKQ